MKLYKKDSLYRYKQAVEANGENLEKLMIRKMYEKDFEPLMQYLEKDPHINLFFIGDLLADRFDDSIQEFYGYYDNNELVGALLLYNKSSLHITADKVGDDLITYVYELYHKCPFSGINMGSSTFDLIDGRLDSIVEEVTKTRLSVYKPNELVVDTSLARRLKKEELAQMLEVQDTIFINKVPMDFEARVKRMGETYDRNLSWYYGSVVDDRVVAIGTATAFTPSSAMIVAVGTIESCRNKGYASALVKVLSDALYKEGMYGVLFYDNPKAASIYERLGYEFYSHYYMLMIRRHR